MLRTVEYQHDELPRVGSELGQALADNLFYWWEHQKRARMDMESIIWPACDDAWHCKRTLPRSKGMKWVDKSDQGESDLKDGLDFLADAVTSALMPRDETWFAPVAYDAEEQWIQNIVRDYLSNQHLEAKTRANYAMHLGQTMRRGTGAFAWEWKKEARMRRMGPVEAMLLTQKAVEEAAANGEFIDGNIVERKLRSERVREIVVNRPVIRPLDMFDVVLDCSWDLNSESDVPYAFRKFMTLEELHATKDADGNDAYNNLDELLGWSVHEISSLDPSRSRNLKMMGVNPMATDLSHDAAYIPVIVFHRPVQRFAYGEKTYVWVDTYFEIAMSKRGKPVRLIRSYENPSDYGHPCVFFDTYRDMIGCAYGVSAIEKSLSTWHQKNVMSALTLNAHLGEIFPPVTVIGGMLVDDRKLELGPGSVNVINYKPQLGANFMATMPVAQGGGQRGMLAQQWLGQKILGQMGAWGAIAQDPTKQPTRAKTATQIQTETTSATTGRDNFLEKIASSSLQPYCQAVHDAALQYETDGIIKFAIESAGEFKMGSIPREKFLRRRKVVVTGYHGMVNKTTEIQELREILATLTQGNAAAYLPNAPAVFQEVIFKLLGRYGLKNLDQLKLPPVQLVLQDPQVQMEFWNLLMQIGLPMEGVMYIAQTLGLRPPQELQQTLQPMAPGAQMAQAAQGGQIGETQPVSG